MSCCLLKDLHTHTHIHTHTHTHTDEVYMTSISWVIPALDQQLNDDNPSSVQPNTPNINTCRPMSYQEDGAKVNIGPVILCDKSDNY